MDTDDKTILRRLKRGDAAALEAAVRQYSGYVTAVIGNQLGPCAAAEDIEELASDVFVALWRAPQSLRTEHLRGWLGRMLFSGEEALKKAKVLSGGEKVRCMLAKMMLEGSNFLILDEPTNHLDLESITSLNNGMNNFKGCMLFTSHDQELMNTVANRIIEINGTKTYDKNITYDEYLDSLNG